MTNVRRLIDLTGLDQPDGETLVIDHRGDLALACFSVEGVGR